MLALIKGVFSDIKFLYTNFIHFVFSKILIYLVTFLITLLLILPFIIIALSIAYSLGVNFDITNINYFWVSILAVFILFALFFFLLGYSYSNILFNKLSLSYKANKKLAYTKNYYFSSKLFFKYMKLFGFNFLILLSPIIFAIAGFFIITAIVGPSDYSQVMTGGAYSISLLILLIFSFVSFIYLTYKIAFSYIILVDESKGTKFKKAIYYIKKSFKLTKGFKNVNRLIVILLLFLTVTLVLTIPENYFKSEKTNISDYVSFLNGTKEINQNNSYYFEGLKLNYSNLEVDELNSKKNTANNMYILFWILDFLVISGVINMILVSFYKRQLLKK